MLRYIENQRKFGITLYVDIVETIREIFLWDGEDVFGNFVVVFLITGSLLLNH